MKHSASLTQRITAAATAATLLISQLAVVPPAEASHLGSSTASAGSAPPPSVAAIQSFQPDLFTGRATTGIPIAVPPGRKGMQPALGLAYSSSGRNSWVGTGWGLDLGYIERSTKNGPPRYDATDTYTFMFQGVASDLVRIPDGTYRAKDEGLFLRFEYSGTNGWEVRDKSGTRYLFGGSPDSEQAGAGSTFRWGLRKVLDTNGNFFTVTYAKDQGQNYLSRIDYTGHETSGVQDLAPANYVQFTTESRPDPDISLRNGTQVTTARRLKEIATYAQGQLARKYVLAYTTSLRTGRSLLAGVTQIGADGVTTLPTTTLAYQSNVEPTYSLASSPGATGQVAYNVQVAGANFRHENFGCGEPVTHPYASLNWSSSTVVSSSATIGSTNWNVQSDGRISMSGAQDQYVHAWIWVYLANPANININTYSFCTWKETPGAGVELISSNGSTSFPAGWSVLHFTAHHEHESFSANLSTPLTPQATQLNPSYFLKPQLAGDVDGNGMTDLITFNTTTNPATWSVALGRGAGFSPTTVWHSGFGSSTATPLLGDWNADGRTDIATYNNSSWTFATSTTTSFQIGIVAPLNFGSGTPLTGDFNGDGIIDVGTHNNGSWQVALGTGSGFNPASSFDRSLGSSSSTPLTGDFNGDGYTDIGIVEGGTVTVALSTGTNFSTSSTWLTGFGSVNYTTADFNGDGLTDAAYYDKPSGQVRYAASVGTQFAPPVTLPVTFSLRSTDDNIQVGDFNGDGLADPAVFNTVTGTAELARSQGQFVDLLAEIHNGLGGATTLQYQPSTQCDALCPVQGVPKLPFVLPVVNRVTVDNGMGHSVSTTYVHKLGSYDAPTREFRGFGKVEVRDADANVTITEFHQDELMKGRPFRTEVRDQFENIWSKSEQIWSVTDPYPGVHFVKLDQTDAFIYDGDATFEQTSSVFTYDQYGNVTRADGNGDASISGDERSATTAYAINETAWILSKPSLVQTLDGDGAVVAQRRFFYDSPGNLTKEEEWLTEPPALSPEQWLATTLTYDAYGNVVAVNDALNRTTTNTYDATGTYVTQIANALGHTRTLVYDARFGAVISSTDQNNVTTTSEYDALGRVNKVIGPTDTAALPTIRYQYDLSPTPPSRTIVQTRINSGQPAELAAYAFTDGLGRTIQTRSPAEDLTKQIVGGAVELDARGLATKQWVPYLDTFSTSYVPTSLVSGLMSPVLYTYDAVGRLLATTDPDGSVSSTTYDDWSVTGTDANGHQTRRTSDAYGRLAMVEEFNNGQTYTTTYQYDPLDNLARVTDAMGNVTTITYDSLGRKLGMVDPDMGAWTYTYDAVDNLTSQVDARGVTITFAYDTLNRLTQKSYTIPAGSGIANPGSVSYTYDTAVPAQSYSKGKLVKITDGSGSSGFEYDILGRLIKESKTIDGTTYTIQRTYDLLGRLTRLTYPDAEYADYTYNTQGGIETLTLRKSGGDTGTQVTPIVSNVDYNAAGQMTKIVNGNGVVTDYSYNPQTLRLASLRTTDSGLRTLQDFSYEFDPVGNVTGITDRAHTGSQTFQYDDLHRLTQASGAYGTLTYAYDPIGNMTEKEGVAMSYGAGPAGPHAVTSTSVGLSMAYDANGNMVEKNPCLTSPVSCLTSQLLSYDAENRLVKVDTAQEETVSVTFQPGWNFFSLPVIPDDGAVAVLLPSFAQDFEQIAKFEPATSSFKHYVGNAKFDDFNQLEYGVGYQVYCKAAAPVTLNITGKVPTQQLPKSLGVGWHLLGSTVLADTALATWLSGVTYAEVKEYAGGALAAATQAKAGKAYWVRLTATSTWTPSLPRNVTTTQVFDGDGGKVKQITAAGTTTYLGEVYEKDPAAKTTKYIFAGDLRIAAKDSTGVLRFYHGDHLGSSNVVTDSTGALVEHTEHMPYGAISQHTGTSQAAHQFTGQRQDTTNGLVLFPARAYDPELGRFLQADPFVQDPGDPQTLNRYSYVRNNPVNLVDPSGYGWLRRLITAIAAIVISFVAPELGIPLFAQALFGAAVVAAADQQGAALERLTQRSATVPSAGAASVANVVAATAGGVGMMAASASTTSLAFNSPAFAGAAGIAVAEPTPVGEAVLAGLAATILLAQGAAALRQALDDALYRDYRDSQIVEGYHSTSRGGAWGIVNEGFNLGLSDPDGKARFGPGFYLSSTPEGARAEYRNRHEGQEPPIVLKIRARLTKNLRVIKPWSEKPLSRGIGAIVRSYGGSITYGSHAPGVEGATNYVLFNPIQQVEDVRIDGYGMP